MGHASRLRRAPRRPKSSLRFASVVPPRPSPDKLGRPLNGFGGRSMLARWAGSRLNMASLLFAVRTPSGPTALHLNRLWLKALVAHAKARAGMGPAFAACCQRMHRLRRSWSDCGLSPLKDASSVCWKRNRGRHITSHVPSMQTVRLWAHPARDGRPCVLDPREPSPPTLDRLPS